MTFDRRWLRALGVTAAFALAGPGWVQADDPTTNAPAASAPAPDMTDTIRNLLAQSSQELAAGDYEGAIRNASTAIQLDPKNASAYELRGSIYMAERLWDRAERDYTAALKISPDAVYKYKLADIAMMAKRYEDAHSRFVALMSDPQLGDLATFKAFLCDLMGFHENAARQDLATMERNPNTPSCYYSHVAWDLSHNKQAEGMKIYAAAQHTFDASTVELYITTMSNSRRIPMNRSTFVTRDGTPYTQSAVFLEKDGLRVSTGNGWKTLPLSQLPDDLTPFPEALREDIARKRSTIPDVPKPPVLVSFTTKSGRTYDQVRWTVEADRVSVLTADGWIAVPFADLPEDRSSFPPELTQEIEAARILPAAPPIRIGTVSFTTRHGKVYDQVKAFPADDGLRVLTADGWITIGFHELPEDTSAFPEGWREEIGDGQKRPATDASGMEVVTFTTKKGRYYEQVRAALGRTGVRLITSNGWIEVPFRDLPTDVTPFPQEWQETIAEREAVTVKDKAPSP